MKMIIKRILPLVLIAWLGALPVLAQPRIATVDLQKVFDKYWRREEAQLALKDREQTFEKEIKSLRDDMEKVAADYDKLRDSAQDQSVTPEERAKRKALADTKLLELKTADNTLRTTASNAQEQIMSQRKRLTDSIFTEINATIKAKAKASGYTLVLNTAAPSPGMVPSVLYSNGDNDMTDAILAQLNAGAPPRTTGSDAPKSDDKSGDKAGDRK
jgi:outer membrane protein